MTTNLNQHVLNPNFSSKFLFFVLALSALIISSVSNPSIPLHVCDQAYDPQSCLSHISEAIARDQLLEYNGIALLKPFLIESIPKMRMAMESASRVQRGIHINNHLDKSIADCIQLMEMSIDRVNSTLAALDNFRTQSNADNAHTWLSAILTNYFTCLDEISDNAQLSSMKMLVQDLISTTRTSLAILASLSVSDKDILRPLNGGFPSWISRRDRRLLESRQGYIDADVVVAQDGSGDYRTIQDAVSSAPDKSTRRYVIYVKRGIYRENVEVESRKQNVVIVGDGMDSTIITASRNAVDGWSTFRSATLAVSGDGFILAGIGVQNTAGPQKYQAVALRVNADQCVVYRCKFDGYQDTLYPHSYRQFYRDCYIIGTIDFILGNAAVVYQNCEIVARRPMAKQKNMITAQGRTDPNQNTGISIQGCDIIASSDLEPVQDVFPTYFGRPWREYARVVIMQSFIGNHVNRLGWAEWDGDFALWTLYYGEFANVGPGADTSNRVTWHGYNVITNPKEAMKFTVKELIQGESWVSSTGVPFTEGL